MCGSCTHTQRIPFLALRDTFSIAANEEQRDTIGRVCACDFGSDQIFISDTGGTTKTFDTI